MTAQQPRCSEALPTSAGASAQVLRVLEGYLASLERGVPPRPEELLAQHPDLAEPLREYLASLEFLHRAALNLHSSEPVSKASPEREAPELGQLGDFRLLREIGRGGMGVVYEAEQFSLSRRVALKILPFAAALDSKQLQRFKNEAQAAAHLQHPNIVPVFGVGCERGVHYYAMQYIEGLTLAAVITELQQEDQRAKRPDVAGTLADRARANETRHSGLLSSIFHPRSSFFRTAANLGLQAAEALEHAHELGVVHRDIKPANLLVDERGNLWITDFGLAHCQSQAGLTLSGDLLGTLRYMSPEQALGKRGLVDHRADVYSLGVTLYELLTLEPAFSGSDREEVLRQIAFEEPLPPRQRNKAIPHELETIVLKAMEKSSDGRYATAQELADDLRRFLDHKPIQAKPPTVLQRASKWCRRNPLLASALTAVASCLVLGTIVAWLLAVWALTERQKALHEANRAQQAETKASAEGDRARRFLYASDLHVAQQAWELADLVRARELLERHRPRGDEEDQRGFEWRHLWWLCRDQSLHTLRGHSEAITAQAFSPDGKTLASASCDTIVRIWDMTARRAILALEHEGRVTSLAFSPNGQLFASASHEGRVILWEVATWRKVTCLTLAEEKHLAFSPDSQMLVATGGRCIKLWDVRKGQVAGTLWGPPGSYWRCLAFSPDGKTLAAGCGNTATVRLWNLATRKEIEPLKGHSICVMALAYSPDAKLLASAGNDAIVQLWDLATRQPTTLRAPANSLAFSPDGKTLAAGCWNGTVKLWDTATKQEVRTLLGHTGQVEAVAFSPQGTTLVSGSTDNTIKLWDLANPGKLSVLPGHKDIVHSLAISPDGQTLASAGLYDYIIKLWNIDTGRELGSLKGHEGPILSVTFSADGRTLASGSSDRTVRLWDVATRRQVDLFRVTSDIGGVALSPDGKTLAAGLSGNAVQLWDIATRRAGTPLGGVVSNGLMSAFAFAPDGKTLAIGSPDGTARLYDITTRQIVAPFEGQAFRPRARNFGERNEAFSAVAISPDGRTFAAAGQDRSIMLWDFATRQPIGLLKGHRNWIWSMAFSPDGGTLASCGADGTVKLWNLKVQQEAATLERHVGQVDTVAFAPDGNLLATAGHEGRIRLWRASPFAQTDAPVISSPAVPEPPHLAATQYEGFLRDWLILARIPLPDGETNGAAAVDVEQIPGEANLRPRVGERVPIGSKELVWKEHRAQGSFIDFNAILGQETIYSVAYAVCYVVSERERKDLQLRYGSDDQAKIYLNGKAVHTSREVRLASVDEDIVGDITLGQGLNVLVFKVVNEGADWAGCIRFVDEKGNPVRGLQVRLSPD